VRLGNLGVGSFKDEDKAFIPLDYYSELKYHAIAEGDLLIAGLGDNNNPLGRACLAPLSILPAIVKADCFRLRLQPARFDPRFLVWYLSSAHAQQNALLASRGSTRQRMNIQDAQNLPVPRPPLDEQGRIADFLDAETARIDRLVAVRELQRTILSARWQSVLSELRGGLVARYGSFRFKFAVRGIEQGWSPQCEERQVEEDDWGVVKAGCVNGGRFRPEQHKALPADFEPIVRYRLRPGDFLMSRASGSPDLIGSVGIVPDDVHNRLLLCDKVYRIRIDQHVMSPTFAAFMLRTPECREDIKLGISGAEGMANNLPTTVIKNLEVPQAPVEVQVSAASELVREQGVADDLNERLHQQLALLAERRQALITAAVTGQIDVTTARGADLS
jgi:type I restriction enzyme S subunit